jgi:hypothetical protein
MTTRRALAAAAAAAALVAAAPTGAPERQPWQWYSGKPPARLELPTDCRYRDLPGLDEPPSGITRGTELRELYLRLHLPKASGPRRVEARFVRASGDATANAATSYGTSSGSRPYTVIHFEQGEGTGGRWQARACGPGRPITIHTRYAKQHTLD